MATDRLKHSGPEIQAPSSVVRQSSLKLSRLRRFVALGIIMLFLLQFVRIKILVGGLGGSVAVWFVKILDVFAYTESLTASGDFTLAAFGAVVPVLGMYLILGRAFCGWVCPMDFLFEVIGKTGRKPRKTPNISPVWGYAVVGSFLIASGVMGVPVFTNYFSHLTNFFRFLTGTVSFGLGFPVEPEVIVFSGGTIAALLVLEYFFPRFWCRGLCPIGRIYGLFNKVSLLRLAFTEGVCGECSLCDQQCYMGVKIARNIDRSSLRDVNCIYCGRCAEGCATKGKIVSLRFWR